MRNEVCYRDASALFIRFRRSSGGGGTSNAARITRVLEVAAHVRRVLLAAALLRQVLLAAAPLARVLVAAARLKRVLVAVARLKRVLGGGGASNTGGLSGCLVVVGKVGQKATFK